MSAPVVCHCSSTARTLDCRVYYMQSLPLAAAGMRVRVIAPHGLCGSRQGVELIPVPVYESRLARFASTAAIARLALSHHSDVYHLHDPELLPLGIILKWVFGKRVVYDTCEDYPSMIRQKRWIPAPLRKPVSQIVAALEWSAARWFDGVVTADPLTLRRFSNKGRSRKLVFFNFPNLDVFPEPVDAPKRFDVVYRGGISERAGAILLLDAVAQLVAAGRSIRVLFIGYYDDQRAEGDFRERVARLGLSPFVELRGRIEHEEMAAALAEARIGVSTLLAVPKFLRNIPVKVFEYWACGLPVINSDLPPMRPFFRDGDGGLLVPPGDPAALAAAMATLLDDPQRAAAMGVRGRLAVVDRFNNSREAHKLAAFYYSIVGGPRSQPSRPAVADSAS